MAERRKQFKLEADQSEPVAPHLRKVGGAEHLPNVSLTLRMARQRAGYDLKDVAEVLRIRLSNLEAIEAGRFDDLPGPTYVTGFLRSYAEFLGLDRDEIVTRYREEIGAASRQKLSFPIPSQEGRVPRFWLVLVALVLVGLAYGGWNYYSSQNNDPAGTVAEPPADTGAAVDPTTTAAPVETKAAPPSEANNATPPLTESGTPNTGTGSSLFEDGGATTPAPSQGSTTPNASVPTAEPAAPKTETAPAATGSSRGLWDDSTATTNAPTAMTATAPVETPQSSTEAQVSAPNGAGETTAAAQGEEADVTETAPAPISTTQADAPLADTAPRNLAPTESATTIAPVSGETTTETLPPPTETEIAALEQSGGQAVAIDASTPTLPATTGGASRIVIGARADSWLQIQGPGNELVMTRILRPGETYEVPAREGLVMVTGNAGGIEIVVDGQPIAPLGPVGVVKRNIALDPDALRSIFGTVSR